MTDKDKLAEQIDEMVRNFKGTAPDLGNALGAYILGSYYGWKPLLLMYSRASIKKYETALKIDFKEVLPEEGELVKRHKAYNMFKDAKSYWDALRKGVAVKDAKIIK